MKPDVFREVPQNIDTRSERELKSDVVAKIVRIVDNFGEPVGTGLGKRALAFFFPNTRQPLEKYNEVTDMLSVSGVVEDKKGNKIDEITVTSYGKNEPYQAKNISVRIPGLGNDGIDTLLFKKRGKKETDQEIDVELWNGNADNIYWSTTKVSFEKELKKADQLLDLLEQTLINRTS